MKLGFIILAHQDLHRATQLVRFLAKNDCPVSLHIDLDAPIEEVRKLQTNLNHLNNVVFAKREKCGWGQFSIVQATLNAAQTLLDTYPDVTNVFLASGSCLPARPLKQLKAYLGRHENIDFIESFSKKDAKWVKGGLDQERFTMYFPVSWREHRFLFDRLTDAQRILRINRTIPVHINPHMGSQWWCLTSNTLRKIINDPKRRENDKYFMKCWIPDESYFQTLAYNHSDNITQKSLTFAMFSSQGKPFMIYDDHLRDLPKTGAFFVRKVWPGADKLYHNLLTTKRKNFPLSKANEVAFNSIFLSANTIRNKRGKGRSLQGNFSNDLHNKSGIATYDYTILTGYSILFEDFAVWARETKGLNVFDNVFKPRHFTFHKKINLLEGNLTANTKIRNSNPKSFLSNLLWGQKEKIGTSVLFDITDTQNIMKDIVKDTRSNFIIIHEAWLLTIANSGMKLKGKIMQAHVLQAREHKFHKELNKIPHKNCTIFSLNDAINTPGLALQAALQLLDPVTGANPTSIPQLTDTSKLDALVRKLLKNGVALSYKPGKKSKKPLKDPTEPVKKPYVVK